MGHGNKLSRKKEQAIIALFRGSYRQRGRRMVKINPATLYKWMALREFEEAYRKARHRAYGARP